MQIYVSKKWLSFQKKKKRQKWLKLTSKNHSSFIQFDFLRTAKHKTLSTTQNSPLCALCTANIQANQPTEAARDM